MSRQKNLKRNLLICLLAGSAVMYTLPLHAATSVVANNALPDFNSVLAGHLQGGKPDTNGLVMDVTQTTQNAVIKWNSFDIGGSATVNFDYTGKSDFNTLNYVNSASASQIYGTINAQHEGYNGNIFVINPAGVQIGPSAQINVGSLYVSNKYLNESKFDDFNGSNINSLIDTTKTANAELMSLGNINAANNVTFDGNRIVLDTDRVIITDSQNGKLNIKTTDTNNVVLGYEAYDENNGYTDTVDNEESFNVTKVTIENGTIKEENTNVKGYMWVEDVEQLQAINTNLGGNYALRNSIDATGTAQNSFNPIGLDDSGKVIVNDGKYGFSGNFDGIDYNIFGLNINKSDKINVGLFGVAHDANINNVTLVGGSITGGSVVGSVVGAALGNTHITNATNSASVTGSNDVGGIVGYSGDKIGNVGENGETENVETGAHFTNLINTGTVIGTDYNDNKNDNSLTNTGGLIGYMYNGTLDGNSYNLGDVSSEGHNVGGLVGHAVNSTIGDGTNLVYNRLDVEGAYNVGGIVGNMDGTTVQNAENSGNVTATGYTNGTYTFHTDNTTDNYSDGVSKTVYVNVSNVGGIAGVSNYYQDKNGNKHDNVITDVLNTGSVSSSQAESGKYYNAGSVGGIVGSAIDTNITNATNQENEVRGAHNVGGVAGYFGNSIDGDDKPKYTIINGINDGGDIMATGARYDDSFVKEIIRPASDRQTEEFIIGNIGGVVGYMDGDNVYVTASANRGTVHTSNPEDAANVKDYEKAANVGGIVGKIDRSDTLELSDLNGENGKITNATVSNSYNTGDVLGYTGVGGVVGMMYNGEVAGSYNLGHITTTRQSSVGVNSIDSLNMGGIVGDTTETSDAKALLYDVYNKGQIGDEEFEYFGRHVGGIVGRLSGDIEKAYNTGAIYNGYSVVGGIAGWIFEGRINNAFNTGNITVYNQNSHSSQVGGIAGAAQGGNGVFINNVYNLGTLRSFDVGYGNNSVGGILGTATQAGTVTINNAYTTGNLYSGKLDKQTNTFKEDIEIVGTYQDGYLTGVNTKINSIYGSYEYNASVAVGDYTYYIQPDNDENGNPLFTKLTGEHDSARHSVEFSNKSDYKYEFDGGITEPTGGDVDENSAWRIYDGNTPILNAFLPKAEDYFSGESGKTGTMEGITSIQYGTAYDPLLTIINAANGTNNLSYNWSDLGISNAAGIAVYGAGLTLKDITTSGGTGYFGGTIYADGALNLNAKVTDTNNISGNIGLGSASQIYGSSVNIDADGKVTIYGDVTATGNTADVNIDVKDAGNIIITGSDVDVYGTLTTGKNVSVPGIEDQAVNTWRPGDVDNPYAEMVDIADRFAHETTNSNVKGDITITANGTADGSGNVNLYFGNKEEGLITTGGNLTVTGTGDVFVDSDLDIAGNMTLTSTGKDGEVLLTLTNIGKVQADRFMDVVEGAINGVNLNNVSEDELSDIIFIAVNASGVDNSFTEKDAEIVAKYLIGKDTNKVQVLEQLNNAVAVEYMHDFMDSFNNTDNYIALNANSGDAKLTVDMWDGNKFNFKKYDSTIMGSYTFVDELEALEFYINEDKPGQSGSTVADASKHVYVEVHNGEQLKGIQDAGNDALGYNYALMGDINASDVQGYEAIGGTTGFTGTFDGRGNRIIGLKVDNNNGNAGIFSTIGKGGTVKNVNIYSGNFTGTDTAGAVAGVNEGRIENVTGFGNTVTVTGDTNNAGNAGGIVGVNKGDNKGNIVTNEDGTITLEPAENEQFATGIIDVESIGSVIAEGNNAVAGGLVGTNEGALGNSYSDSAVTSTFANNQAGLGGVVGVNTENGDVQYVDSLGVTNGGTTGSSNVGGIIGVNNGNMYSGYNESIVSGSSNVGGIIGQNTGKYENNKWNGGTVENVVNATGVTGSSNYVGGLVGTNTGSVTNGRNNGTITGTNYVGGLVGDNADEHSILTNLVNDSSAEILGVEYVGGIAGKNSGTITADRENNNLINRGSITGHKYVGGVAGLNVGTITNTNIDVELKVNNAVSGDHQYFGGIVGQNGDDKNEGTIENATNSNKIVAPNASYVGGIVGWNTEKGKLIGMGNSNEGEVIGGSYVGGVIGKNDAAIGSKNAAQVGIKNEGVVIATNGGAGGLIGENNAAITNTIMTNKGEVHGNNSNDGSGTGGLIGTNSGAISYSSMTNEVTGTVTGVYNVGGLIGVNKADITGGRENTDGTDAGMYINKIYNNGVIKVGSYTDANDDGKYEFAASNGQNIGGLFGTNSGTVKAAYNTGAINASGSENVGGIAGANSGTLDQVFNTVMTADGQNATISGGTNVGGLVGTNSGTLSNAYNTTEVKSTNSGVVGNAVGVNDGKDAKVNFVYDVTNTDNKLIGKNSGNVTGSYSGNEADGNVKGITYVAEGDRLKENTYQASLNDANTWKFYDGNSNPLLKVFLTTLTVDSNKVDLVYNAGEQDLNIGQLVQNGIISAPVVKDGKDNIIYDGMDAYHNTVIKDEDNKLGESELLQNTTGQKDAGTYDNWLYSGQIASGSKDGSGFNPNNLGYDIVYTKNDSGETGVEIGKATINIDLGKVEHTYGNADVINGTGDFKNEAGYGFNITNSNLTQEMKDELNDKGLGFVFEKDNALTGDTSGRVTEDVKDGGYTWSANFELSEELKKNYQFDDNGSATLNKADGQSIVNQAKLEISVDDAETMPGVMPGFTGKVEGLTNGDDTSLDYVFGLGANGNSIINVNGIYDNAIGIVVDGKYYELTAAWTDGLFKNYNVTYNMGTLTVDSEIMPDLPDNWPNNRWDYLFGDNPFDRNENFRERKAEVNFVDGAMEI